MIKDGLIVVVTCCVFAFFCDASRNAATGGTMSSSKTFVRSHKKQQDSLIKIFDGTKDKHSSHGFTAPSNEDGVVPYFLRSFDQLDPDSIIADKIPSWLAGMSHYRLLPGFFPEVVKYHFDGLATVAKFEVNSDASTIHLSLKPFASKLESNFENCIFMGTGTGPTLGDELCVQNPGVNLLPIQSQLWLTIDTSAWGRVDPSSLETIQGAKVNVSSQVLNAHPACDRSKNICYVQHPCPKTSPPPPLSDQVCYSILKPQSGDAADMETTIISRVTLKEEKLIQHSHSPCLTQNWVVSKLDSFEPRLKSKGNAGVLKLLHQSEDSLWLIMDRRTNKSVVMESDIKFVNNHFWNCVEDKTDGSIIVDTVAATEDYLDTYFQHNLNGTVQWDDIFHPPLRCRIPTNGTSKCVKTFIFCLTFGTVFASYVHIQQLFTYNNKKYVYLL